MPNLVPISLTPQRVMHFHVLRGLVSGRIHTDIELADGESAAINVQRSRESWIPATYAFTSPLEGCPEPWRDASGAIRFDSPNNRPAKPHPDYKPNLSDVDVRCRQFARLAGIIGTSVLSRSDYRTGKKAEGRMVTARGKPTANVPVHLSACLPDLSAAMPSTDGDDGFSISGNEIRFLKRYREAMRGTAYAAAMATEKAERHSAVMRAAFPWIPCDSHGKLWQGVPYRRQDGIGERIYSDGTMLTQRRNEWLADQAAEAKQLDRDAEIALLKAQSEADAKATRYVKVVPTK